MPVVRRKRPLRFFPARNYEFPSVFIACNWVFVGAKVKKRREKLEFKKRKKVEYFFTDLTIRGKIHTWNYFLLIIGGGKQVGSATKIEKIDFYFVNRWIF